MQFLFLRANDLRFGATSQSPLRGYQQPRKHGHDRNEGEIADCSYRTDALACKKRPQQGESWGRGADVSKGITSKLEETQPGQLSRSTVS